MKPILFNGDMVRAILDGRKTVTRRFVKQQPLSKLAYCCMGHKHGTWGYPDKDAWKYWDDKSFRLPDGLSDEEKSRRWAPPCHTGDILYVRETWNSITFGNGNTVPFRTEYWYKADDTSHNPDDKWRPSIHMPREAARIFLRVTGVRVERLHEMGIEDALKEGVTPVNRPGGCKCQWAFDGCMEEPCANRTAYEIDRHIDPFIQLWDRTLKPADRALYGWAANPWVWVIEFERISREEANHE